LVAFFEYIGRVSMVRPSSAPQLRVLLA
jgi:hypothetical protein